MNRPRAVFLPTGLTLAGLTLCCALLWNQSARFRQNVEQMMDDIRITRIDLDGKVLYDTAGEDLPNHAARAEFEAVRDHGGVRNAVRESETLNQTMFYHARRVGDGVLRLSVPYRAVSDAKAYATHGLLAALGTGALTILTLFFFSRRYEQRLSRLAAERDLQTKLLDEMHKLETFRKDFISNVTHEIKTPVTGILGAVELLADETAPLGDQDRRDLQTILRDQAIRLNALVEDILALARLERAESSRTTTFASCPVVDIVQTAVNLARPTATQKAVQLLFQPTDDLLPLARPCDPRLIEEALTNLLQNALRYSDSPTVELRMRPAEHGKVSVLVIDHGIGIPEAHQPRLFERFYRVDKDRSRALGGTGLGLAIVKHIAQLHHGEVSLVSRPGEGAIFTLTF